MDAADRRVAKRAVAVAIAILIVMVVVRTCMQRREEVSPYVAPSATASSSGKSCSVSTKPAGATVHALRGGERVALGITPMDVEQGDYDLRIELEGYAPVDVHVGDHAEIHRDLVSR